MVEDDAPEIEYSPLCGGVTRDGITVHVEIYRLAEGDEGWSLEVVDQENGSTVWNETFASETKTHMPSSTEPWMQKEFGHLPSSPQDERIKVNRWPLVPPQ